jgi:hypothetical protein
MRGSVAANSSAASYSITFPAGTLVGDLAILSGGHGFAFGATIAGWTTQNLMSGTNWNGAVYTRILTSLDIQQGFVTITAGGGFNGYITLATMIGATAGVREVDASRNGSGSATINLSTSGAVLATDSILYFGSNRANSATDSVNRGTLKQQGTDATASGCLYFEQLSGGGAVTATFSYPTAGTGNYQACIVMKGA